MISISLSDDVRNIINRLNERGFEAYAVGGSIRDSLMNRQPKDWDITTSATPEEVKNIFKNTIDTGIAHGTVTVRMNMRSYEVTTYRIDGKYSDSRHPESVEFTSELSEDLRRRDFTINAMAYNETEGLIDLYGGRRDIELGIIRCVGDPECRFDEDALRTLRAVRFVARTGFRLDAATALAIRKKAYLLKNISAERIREELSAIITSDRPEALLLAHELGITAIVLPELDLMLKTEQNSRHHFTDVGSHSLISMKYVRADFILRWTMLLHDIGKPEVRTTDENGTDHFKTHESVGAERAAAVLDRLKFDNSSKRRILRLIKHHTYRVKPDKPYLRRLCHLMDGDMELMFEVQRADIKAHTHRNLELFLDRIEASYQLYCEILEAGDAVSVADLKINGNDLLLMGIDRGPRLGSILNQLLEIVMDEPKLNNKEDLKRLVPELAAEEGKRGAVL